MPYSDGDYLKFGFNFKHIGMTLEPLEDIKLEIPEGYDAKADLKHVVDH
eukprot:CAMPEP_0116871020 /NCGR_PEP_ID=MMETSP0463-20121206/1193_1 /TAXON_ID=181622 /ORGANISM="Strombidinopsis sp, Strain SopsisLIS2011" /LENGTH=48 /DNA_ID= /DNA_START= /DNA_END= /DNA_ORIENTATION=